MSAILTHLKLPGDSEFREVVDEEIRKEVIDLENPATGIFADLLKKTIGLYVDEEGYICQEVIGDGE